MKPVLLASALALALAFAGSARAQDTNEGAYDALSPGNQMIVDAIHESQTTTDTLLTKDDIAAMKADTGWGNMYNQLYEDGLVTERNLGLAISKHLHESGVGTPETVVTTGSGNQVSVGQGTNPVVGAQGQGAPDAAPGERGHAFGHAVAGGHGGGTTITTGSGATITTGPGGAAATGIGATVTTGAGAHGAGAGIAHGAGGQGRGHGAGGRPN